jgi:hypothetical protein
MYLSFYVTFLLLDRATGYCFLFSSLYGLRTVEESGCDDARVMFVILRVSIHTSEATQERCGHQLWPIVCGKQCIKLAT